jgi:hypothetical protein
VNICEKGLQPNLKEQMKHIRMTFYKMFFKTLFAKISLSLSVSLCLSLFRNGIKKTTVNVGALFVWVSGDSTVDRTIKS